KCAPHWDTRALLLGRLLPVGDEPLVGGLGLARELHFPLALLFERGDAGLAAPSRAPALRTGSELELAQLSPRQRRAPEGVVLVLGEQVPEQDHELARDGDRRPARAAPGRGALGERAQRARVAKDD